MNKNRLTVFMAFALLATAACKAKEAAPSTDGSVSATTSDAPAVSTAPQGEVTARDIAMYPLDMDKMRKWLKATKDLETLGKAHPELAQGMSSSSNEPPSQTIAKIDGNPAMKNVLRQNGLTPRDYVMIMGAYLQAGMIAGALSVNPNGKVPDGQSPQNIEFVKTHRAELDRMFKEAGMISN